MHLAFSRIEGINPDRAQLSTVRGVTLAALATSALQTNSLELSSCCVVIGAHFAIIFLYTMEFASKFFDRENTKERLEIYYPGVRVQGRAAGQRLSYSGFPIHDLRLLGPVRSGVRRDYSRDRHSLP